MIGIEFIKDPKTKEANPGLVSQIVAVAAQNGLIIESAGIYGNVIRFLAPLVMTDDQLEAGLNIFEKAIESCIK
ncbi:MAG: 4-aminobutyrate aminotransferase / (S)-3-amino-2-methylpropionate transaminase / 5-aminovalerate [Eubacteriaceae bacterium]|jgi:4-aminobutyrate aminotransferase/(S)-3-amino-2-methylpropionate transaminase|nr:4-aminobutyrate aminotransferase / (S)-3-amino-2-methylpropionate transaminase / 5-aminovalerate [Eubacteriaceae bacterium]MDK2905215.1 4-aminobutyrate aminotransferase / (S)-3-amino-2-methylpropionate transaminase / 5-aminovalerate [Eubacteriaceae bacterium]MDK2937597.1 4-aminobutyrate aminotransferase / (S)-3-amino-2-methylpropionate transaminase / 5-aminovalerate [Eubacteriaceae bacterium]MDK2961502.1 4-aminobutyrate aminotransferase / (S)-3-amino-2-methylpropionate transaminase / 5-aminov